MLNTDDLKNDFKLNIVKFQVTQCSFQSTTINRIRGRKTLPKNKENGKRDFRSQKSLHFEGCKIKKGIKN